MNEQKNKLVKKELLRLKRIFKEIEGDKKSIVIGLMENAAYMRITLDELKDRIDEEGAIDEMAQGEYTILREHPALKAYNTMIQRYGTVIKQLLALLPEKIETTESDGFEDFVYGRN